MTDSSTDDDATALSASQSSNQQQYLRKVGLFVTAGSSGLDLSNMRIVFKVYQSDGQSTPNYATIKVYNLSADTSKSVQKEFTAVRLQAGYEGGSYGVIFNGSIKMVRRGRDNPTDTFLEILAADGDVARNFGIVNTTLAAGAKLQDQIAAVTKALGLPTSYVPPDIPLAALSRGKVLYGMARDRMDDIAASASATWSIQNGQVQVVPLTSYIPGTAVVLNSNSGMIGVPQQLEDGIHIDCLINPRIKIGTLVQIDNKSIQTTFLGGQNLFAIGRLENIPGLLPKVTWDGIYRVYVCEHTGDTRGTPWYSNLICLAIDASAPSATAVLADG
jgi:archaellin